MERQPRPSLAWLWGLLFGGLLIVVYLFAQFATLRLARSLMAIAMGQMVMILIALLAFFLAGLVAAQRSRRLESGMLAGFVAGLVTVLGIALLDVLRFGAYMRAMRFGLAAPHVAPMLSTGSMMSGCLFLLSTPLIGLGMGALGGLAGRGRAPLPQQPFAPMPPSGYGVPPSAPPPPPTPSAYIPSDTPTVQTGAPPTPPAEPRSEPDAR